MADSRVGILIEAKDNASSTIKNVKGSLNDLGKGAGEISSLSGAFGALGKAAGLAGVAIGAIQAGKAIVELAQLGAQAQRIETSFQTLAQQAGISSEKLLSDLQKASSGTIANTELMLTANRALALGVADSSEELQQLMEVAIARGKALGLSAQQAFNDLVTGIGRISPLILDNLGIITGGEKVFDDYASSIGKVGSQLSDTERKQALVNKVIAESRDLVRENAAAGTDAAASFERVGASFQNLKSDLGELFGPAIAAFANSLADAVDATANAVSGTKATIDLSAAEAEVTGYAIAVQQSEAQLAEYEARLAQLTVGSREYTNAQIATREVEAQVFANRSNLITAQQTYFDVLRATYPAQEQNAEALNRTSVEAEAAARAIQSGSSAMQQQQSAAANLGGSLAVLAGTYDQVAAAQARIAGSLTPLAGQVAVAAGAEAGLQFLEQSTIELAKQEQKWQQLGYSASEVEVLTYQYKEQLRKTAEETYVFGQAATKANQLASQSVKALNAEYENLKSTASGILTASLNDIGGVNLDDILPREDAVNEDARRLADIAVKGFDSPWAAYFKEKFPEIFDQLASSGDPKTAAAQILREFQNGLRPELLDKNRAKELVKRAIIGEQNIKALSDEIAKEVAQELGVSIQEAQSAAAKALGGTTTEQNTQKISVVPTIDRTQLGDQKLEFNATVNAIQLGENVLKEIVLLGKVNTIELTDAVALPILAAEMAISRIVIPDEVKPPVPVIVGGMTIDAVALRGDVAIPEVVIAGTVDVTPPDTTPITENVLSLSAIVEKLSLADNIALPILSAEMVVSTITIADGVTPPTPSIVGGLTIDAILLPSTVEVPQVTTQADTTIVLLNKADIESQPLQVTAEVALPDALELSANVNLQPLDATAITEKPLQLSALVAVVQLSDGVEIPLIRSAMVLDSVTIADETVIPVPPVVGNMTIDGVVLGDNIILPAIALDATATLAPIDTTAAEQTPVNLAATVDVPELDFTGTVTIATPDTSAITSQVLELSAIVARVSLGDGVELPTLQSAILVNAITIQDGVIPQLPTLTQQLIIDAVTLADTVALPEVDITANTTIALLNKTTIEETPLQLSANVTLPELPAIDAIVNLQAPNTEAITGTALEIPAFVRAVTLADNAELPTLESGMILNSVTISDDTELPAPAIVGVMTISSVSLSENVVLPIVNLSAIAEVQPLDITAIEQTVINVKANVELPDLSAPLLINVPAPDLTGFTEAEPVLNAAVDIDWTSASIDVAPDEVVQRLALNLPAYIDFESIDTETPKLALLERLALPIVPTVNVDGIESEEQLFAITRALTPSLVPIVDYQAMSQDELVNAGFFIATGITEGIVNFNLGNAIVAELVKAQAALRSNGIASGQTWGAGFNAGAGEYITGIVQTVVNLALAQITRNSTRTGAQ